MKKQRRIYQSLPVGMLLCAVGGSLDADSFLLHGHVFAGLQTGNLVLLGAGYSQLNPLQILKYVVALVAFVVGLVLTRICQDRYNSANHHCSLPAIAIGVEILLLLAVCLMTSRVSDLLLIGLMSLVGAIQLQMFQHLHHHPFTPLMMMGHIKKTINFLDRGEHQRMMANLLTLVSFFLGAIVTGLLVPWLDDWSLGFAIGMLIVILILAKLKK